VEEGKLLPQIVLIVADEIPRPNKGELNIASR